MRGVCVYVLYLYLVYTVHCTVGWVNFRFLSIYGLFAVPLGAKWGNNNLKNILVQQTRRATHLKVYFQNIPAWQQNITNKKYLLLINSSVYSMFLFHSKKFDIII